MNIVIIEDETLAADRLEKMLYELEPEGKVLAKLGSVKESVKWLSKHTTDLIFLDIQLSDGLSFSIFEHITVSTPVIFTTAYDQYAVKAFELNSISYLLKPIRKSALEQSLSKYRSMKTAFGIDFENLLASYQGKNPGYKKRFLIRIGDTFKKVETKEIAYFFAMEKTVFLTTFRGKTLSVDESLDALEGILNPALFFRINRKFIIHLESIDQMIAWGRGRIKVELNPPLSEDMEAVVSMERSADFKRWLNQ